MPAFIWPHRSPPAQCSRKRVCPQGIASPRLAKPHSAHTALHRAVAGCGRDSWAELWVVALLTTPRRMCSPVLHMVCQVIGSVRPGTAHSIRADVHSVGRRKVLDAGSGATSGASSRSPPSAAQHRASLWRLTFGARRCISRRCSEGRATARSTPPCLGFHGADVKITWRRKKATCRRPC